MKKVIALFLVVTVFVSLLLGSYVVKVEAKTVKVTKVTLNHKDVYLYPASLTYKLKATVYPKNATNKKVVWYSSNKKIATVSSTGLVTFKTIGTITITVKTKDGNKTAKCRINMWRAD